ncbi:LysR family transcriptional regulator, partial [Actinomadura sp. NPDC000929]|uniref:helix-turn-helix domain-containing protein n=1 Tax=Actinomadura sp. NPDC000929 TaxID=3154517 RepID=UPI0033986DCC
MHPRRCPSRGAWKAPGRAFLAVVDDGRFTEAADRLGMTQQAVSKRIAKLEAALGVPLLHRSRT